MSERQIQHELVAALKDLALELGRTPSRDEFVSRVTNGRYLLSANFGSYSAFVSAAGLDPTRRPRADMKKILGRDIEQEINAHKPSREIASTPDGFKPILIVGDTHFPFVHQKTLERIYRFAEKEKPAFIVQVGDLMDQWSHSRFPASRNYYKPDEEMELARNMSVAFWLELQKASPSAQKFQLIGNHDLRMLKQVLAGAPTLEGLVSASIEKLYEFEGVTTIKDYREELIIQDIMFHHGYMTRHGQHRDFVMQNLCTGHTHRGAVVYRALKEKTIAHLDVGFVGDAESKALSYTAQKLTGWTLGWGWWDEYGPRFIPV